MFLRKNCKVFRIITLMRLQVYTGAHALGACPLSLRSYDTHLEWGVTIFGIKAKWFWIFQTFL